MIDPKAELYSHDLSAATWRKSSYSAGEHECVEVTTDLPVEGLAVRDSKNINRTPLRFSAECWTAFNTAVSTGTL